MPVRSLASVRLPCAPPRLPSSAVRPVAPARRERARRRGRLFTAGARVRGHGAVPSSRAATRRRPPRAEQARSRSLSGCPSLPVARRTHMGVPVGVRVNLTHASSTAAMKSSDGFEPGPPEPLLPRPAPRRVARRRDLSLTRTAGYPPRPRAAREAPRPRGRAARDLRRGRRGRARAFPRPVPRRRRGRRYGKLFVLGDEAAAPPRWSGGRARPRRAAERALAGRLGWKLVLLRAGPARDSARRAA